MKDNRGLLALLLVSLLSFALGGCGGGSGGGGNAVTSPVVKATQYGPIEGVEAHSGRDVDD